MFEKRKAWQATGNCWQRTAWNLLRKNQIRKRAWGKTKWLWERERVSGTTNKGPWEHYWRVVEQNLSAWENLIRKQCLERRQENCGEKQREYQAKNGAAGRVFGQAIRAWIH